MRLPRPIWLLLLSLGCTETPLPPPPAVANPVPPDVVLVVIDTLRADRLGAYGGGATTSPSIDQMAAEGLRFDRAYAQSGWTLASFTSLFTGLLPHQHRVGRSPTDPDRFGRLPPARTTLAEVFQAQGYATAAVANNTFLAPEFGLHQGFDSYDWQGARNDAHRSADETVAAALAWLNAQPGPAFVVVHMMEPHLDYLPPDWAVAAVGAPEAPQVPTPLTHGALKAAVDSGTLRTDGVDREGILARYDAEIRVADRAVGTLRAGIAARGRPTLTVLTSDHGEEFWEHGAFEHGHSLHGELVRVPLIATGPGLAVGTVSTVVQHLDVFQGLVATAGAARPPETQGASVFAVAAATDVPDRVAIAENTLYGDPLVSIVDPKHRLVVNQRTQAGTLWAVAADGSELVRLEGPSAETEALRLRGVLARVRGGTLDPVEPELVTSIEDRETFLQLQSLGYLDVDPGETP